MKDRRDKFVYTDPRQIKIIPKGQTQALQELKELIVCEGLDAEKVLALVRDRLDEVQREAER